MKRKTEDQDEERAMKRYKSSVDVDAASIIQTPEIASIVAKHLRVSNVVNLFSCTKKLKELDTETFWDPYFQRFLCADIVSEGKTLDEKSKFMQRPWYHMPSFHLALVVLTDTPDGDDAEDEKDRAQLKERIGFLERVLSKMPWASVTMRVMESEPDEEKEKEEDDEYAGIVVYEEEDKDSKQVIEAIAELKTVVPENSLLFISDMSPGYLHLAAPRLLWGSSVPLVVDDVLLQPFTVVGCELEVEIDTPDTYEEFEKTFISAFRIENDSWLQDTWLGSYSYELGRHNTALSLARSGVRSDAKFEGISIGMDWDKFSEIFPEFKAAKPGRTFICNGLCGTLTAIPNKDKLSRLRWQFVCDTVKDLTIDQVTRMRDAFEVSVRQIVEKEGLEGSAMLNSLSEITPEKLKELIDEQEEEVAEVIREMGVRSLKFLSAETMFEAKIGKFKALMYCYPNRFTGSVEFAMAVELFEE